MLLAVAKGYTPGWGRRAITKTRALVGSCSIALRSLMNRYGGHLVAYRHSHFWVRSVAFAPTSIPMLHHHFWLCSRWASGEPQASFRPLSRLPEMFNRCHVHRNEASMLKFMEQDSFDLDYVHRKFQNDPIKSKNFRPDFPKNQVISGSDLLCLWWASREPQVRIWPKCC